MSFSSGEFMESIRQVCSTPATTCYGFCEQIFKDILPFDGDLNLMFHEDEMEELNQVMTGFPLVSIISLNLLHSIYNCRII